MGALPPRNAERLLTAVLGTDDEARTILGDLAEDFAEVQRKRGDRTARLWYWREALGLAASTLGTRAVDAVRPRSATTGEVMSSGVAQDLRYAVRTVRRDPGFFAFATGIVGLGVGAATAVFSVVSPLMLQPLPFAEPERLVLVENTQLAEGLSGVTSRTSNLRDFRDRARSFDGLAGFNAFSTQSSYNLVGEGPPERLAGAEITDDFLDVLGVVPAVGRDFTPEEGLWAEPPDEPGTGAWRAVMLTHGFWVRRFAADPGVVGSVLRLDDLPYEVVGVLPPDFDFSSVFAPSAPVDIVLPWPISDETDNWGNTTTIVGRLRPGASAAVAQAELESIVAALEQEDPERWGLGARVSGLQERIARPYRPGMLLLSAAAGVLMLIVCVNLANMLLARSPRRAREMAIRRTMGATRGRLVRQLLLESTILGVAGGLVGVAVASLAVRFVTGTAGLDIPLLGAIDVDASALVFSAVAALLAGLAVGVLPALQVADGGEAEVLASGSRGSSGGRAGRRLREAFVVSEVAMACLLLVLGGLVLRSFRSVASVELGFDPEDVVAWHVNTARGFDSLAEIVAYYDEVVSSVLAVPGVTSVGLVDALPLGTNRTWGGRVVGKDYPDGGGESYFPHVVDHRYIDAMKIPLIEGRGFEASDDRSSTLVVIVNETAARTMFPDGRALGQQLRLWYGDVEVIGVVGDVKHRALELGADNEIYFPMTQLWDFGTLAMVVRSGLPTEVLAPGVSAAVQAVDRDLPTDDFVSLRAEVDRAVSPRRFVLQLLGAFAAAALLLAALGIYAVLSYSVAERRTEIGIRMALGESAEQVRRGLVGRTVGLALVGVVVGVGGAVWSARAIRSLLFGVEPVDPATYVGTVAIVLGVAFFAALVPAVRASRTDSATALRAGGL